MLSLNFRIYELFMISIFFNAKLFVSLQGFSYLIYILTSNYLSETYNVDVMIIVLRALHIMCVNLSRESEYTQAENIC